MDPEMKEWIDNASYEELLRRWRTAPVGSNWFQGEIGAHYTKVMLEKRKQDPEAAVRVSKNIGW